MCNCNSSPSSICNQCAQGNPCGCPPDYTVTPLNTTCGCCPAGYTYVPATTNNPATCRDSLGGTRTPVPCPTCEETLSSDCVIVPPTSCGFIGGSVTDLAKFMCSEPYIEKILQIIGNSVRLNTEFCQLVSSCPTVPATSAPHIGSVNVHFP